MAKKTPKSSRFTMLRMGSMEFTVRGANHCGVAEEGEVQKARYVVQMRCEAILDGRGFLVEQRTIDAHMQKVKKVTMSCESLVFTLAHELVEVILKENPAIVIRWLSVRLLAAPYAASMEYKFRLI